jgi:hypothetical protein
VPEDQKPYVFRVTHKYVKDPASVERGHRVWAMYLVERLRKQVGQNLREDQPG